MARSSSKKALIFALSFVRKLKLDKMPANSGKFHFPALSYLFPILPKYTG